MHYNYKYKIATAFLKRKIKKSKGYKRLTDFTKTFKLYNYRSTSVVGCSCRTLKQLAQYIISISIEVLMLRNLNIILIFLLNIRIFVNVIFQVIKIELKIAMRKKHIISTRKVNMYSNRLVLTKLLKYMLTFLVGMAFSSQRSSVRF